MTMPGEAGIPSRTCLKTSLLSETALHELDELLDCGQRILAAGPDGDFAAVLGGQHHYPHDALAVDLEVILADPHVGAEAGRKLDEFRGGPGVQAVLVPDRNRAFMIDGRRTHSTTLRSVPRRMKATSVRKTGSRTALPNRMPSRAAA